MSPGECLDVALYENTVFQRNCGMAKTWILHNTVSDLWLGTVYMYYSRDVIL